jgi:hypothetical protein
VHLCVYLADDLVYTKNGLNSMQPWVIMKLDDVLACFPSDKERRLLVFRARDSDKSSPELMTRAN